MRSYSQLSTWQECPEKYRIKYVARASEPPSVWTVGGTAFHSCAEWYLRGELGPVPVWDKIRNAWDVAWQIAEAEARQKLPNPELPIGEWRKADRGKEDAGWWRTNGPVMVENFIGWWHTSRLEVLTDGGEKLLEHRIETEFGGVPVVAIPDAVVVDEYGQADILDYKSGRRPPKNQKQLDVYRAALKVGLDLDPVWGLFYMTRAQRALHHQLGKDDVDQITNEFLGLQEAIDDQHFPPTPGDACKFCPFKRDLCRFYNPETTA